eukprot:3030633-Alexandrium_andersonii.AAC.1
MKMVDVRGCLKSVGLDTNQRTNNKSPRQARIQHAVALWCPVLDGQMAYPMRARPAQTCDF